MVYEIIDTRENKNELDIICLNKTELKAYYNNLKEFEKQLFKSYNNDIYNEIIKK